jgi:hypothetical protein
MMNMIRVKISTKGKQVDSLDDKHSVSLRLEDDNTILALLRRFTGGKIRKTTPSTTNNPHRLNASHNLSASSFINNTNHSSAGYPCTTEDNGTSSLAFNMTRNASVPVIHRFEPGSTLSYFVDQGDLSPYNFRCLRLAMHTTADRWNLCSMGVTFEEVPKANKAVFYVVYYPSMGSDTYAKAFLPSDYNSDYNKTIAVGPLSFEPDKVDFLSNVLCHELGHVLGIRHTYWEKTEPCQAAFYFPTRALDSASIMNSALAHTLALLVISKKDAEEVRQLYSLAEGLHGRGAPCGEFHIRDVCVKRPWDVWRVW